MDTDEENFKRTIVAMQKSFSNIRETAKRISLSVPKIEIPELNYNLLDISKIDSPEVVSERSAWERHAEVLSVLETSLSIQERILEEQISTSKMTYRIILLTIVSILISILTVLKSFSII